jgi:hypothetical protein
MALSYSQRRSMFKRSEALAAEWSAEAVRAERERRAVEAARVEAAHAERAARDAAAPRDIGSLVPGDLVRDSAGWHVVARVNAKSVSVLTPWSWTDRIEHARIIETRKAES